MGSPITRPKAVGSAFQFEPVLGIVEKRRRQRRSGETRQKILAAASTEFARCGYAGSSTRLIAEAAGVRHGLITHHFGGKDGLFAAVVQRYSENYRQVMDKRLNDAKDLDAAARLRIALDQLIRLAASNIDYPSILSHARTTQGPGEDLVVKDKNMAWLYQTFLKLISAAQKAGVCVGGNPSHVYIAIITVATRVFSIPLEVDKFVGMKATSEVFIQKHVDLCCQLFLPKSAKAPR